MTVYNLVLFAHVVGAIGYCISIAVWLLVLTGLRRAQRVEQARALTRLTDVSGPFGATSALLVFVAGLYLAISQWSLLTSWILVALISLLVMVPTVAIVVAPRRNALVKQLEREAAAGEISPALKQRLRDPFFFHVIQMVAILLLGIIFLMTIKPDLLSSLITMGVALLVGLALSVFSGRAGQTGGMKQVEDRSQAPLG
jgi:uncharacterized membrane protein